MTLVWTNRDGIVTNSVPARGFPALAPNRPHIAVSQRTLTRTLSNTDIWLIDTAPDEPKRFTFDPAFDISPVWSSDGSHVAFASNRSGVFDLFEKPVTFARDERVLLSTGDNKFPVDWSPDGKVLLFVNEAADTGDDIWALPMQNPQRAAPFVNERHAESQGQFSPDGRWVAYRSNESGRWGIESEALSRPRQPATRLAGRWNSAPLAP